MPGAFDNVAEAVSPESRPVGDDHFITPAAFELVGETKIAPLIEELEVVRCDRQWSLAA